MGLVETASVLLLPDMKWSMIASPSESRVEMSGTRAKVDGVQIEYANLPAQARFLAAISQLNAKVLLSLKELSDAQTRPPTRRALKLWARRWNIEADWVVEWAAHTVEWQRRGPNKRWERFFHPLWSPTSRFERRPPTIDVVIKRRVGPSTSATGWAIQQQSHKCGGTLPARFEKF